jgi:hypothetical protein
MGNPGDSLRRLAGPFPAAVVVRARATTRGHPRTINSLRAFPQSQDDLAKQFSISQGEVSRIVNGELYADVPTGEREQELIKAIERADAEMMASSPVV